MNASCARTTSTGTGSSAPLGPARSAYGGHTPCVSTCASSRSAEDKDEDDDDDKDAEDDEEDKEGAEAEAEDDDDDPDSDWFCANWRKASRSSRDNSMSRNMPSSFAVKAAPHSACSCARGRDEVKDESGDQMTRCAEKQLFSP